MMDILLQPDWDPGGSMPDSVGVVIPPKRCNVMNPGSEGRHAVCAAGICGYARPGTILTNPG